MKEKTKNSYIEDLEKLTGSLKIIDLTHSLESSMPAWPTQARFGSVVYDSYDYGGAALHSLITMSEHTGTHIDAPKHFIRGGCPIDRVPFKKMMGRGVNIDVHIAECGLLGPEAIKKFEKTNGEIRKGDIVMFRFGWDKKYKLQPDAAEYLKNWPGLSKEAAQYLAGKEITAAGCDTLSIDVFGSRDNPAHQVLLGRGILVIENIANLDKVPVMSFVIGMPNKFKGGSGSPIRLMAFIQ